MSSTGGSVLIDAPTSGQFIYIGLFSAAGISLGNSGAGAIGFEGSSIGGTSVGDITLNTTTGNIHLDGSSGAGQSINIGTNYGGQTVNINPHTVTIAPTGTLNLGGTTGIYATPAGYFYVQPGSYAQISATTFIELVAGSGITLQNSGSGAIDITNYSNVVNIFGTGEVQLDTIGGGGRVQFGAINATSIYISNSACATVFDGTSLDIVNVPVQTGTVAVPSHTPPAGYNYMAINSSTGHVIQFSA